MRRLVIIPALLALLVPVAVRAEDPPPVTGAVTEGAASSGHITDLDRDKGTVEITLTNGDEITVSMPESAMRGFKEGDPVIVSSRITVNEVPRSATAPPDNERSDDAD
jgi:hypothetical protein